MTDKENTFNQILKMIASGEIPKEVYNKYLSNCEIGFMNYDDLKSYFDKENNFIFYLEGSISALQRILEDKENKSAREMFEELGYKVEIDNKETLKYKQYGNKYGEDDIEIYNIVFDKFSRCFYTLFDGYMSVINIPEHKAINKQIEELGWE